MKSFSALAKEELYKSENDRLCCNSAEFAGMLLFGCNISGREIRLVTESVDVLGRFEALCRKSGFDAEVSCSPEGSGRYAAQIDDREQIGKILLAYGLRDGETSVIRYRIMPELLKDECCRRAFIKGAFMGGGTMVDPNKNYNIEIVTPYMGLSRDFVTVLLEAGFDFKSVVRKSKYVLYSKNSEIIEDFLSYIGAYKAQMELINIKIEKGIRNDFNRSVNSETANLDKAIAAAVIQIQAIETIDREIGLDNLPEELLSVAKLRLKYKSMSLLEIGKHLNPPLGKSGVNHRFKRIISMAERIEDTSEE